MLVDAAGAPDRHSRAIDSTLASSAALLRPAGLPSGAAVGVAAARAAATLSRRAALAETECAGRRQGAAAPTCGAYSDADEDEDEVERAGRRDAVFSRGAGYGGGFSCTRAQSADLYFN